MRFKIGSKFPFQPMSECCLRSGVTRSSPQFPQPCPYRPRAMPTVYITISCSSSSFGSTHSVHDLPHKYDLPFLFNLSLIPPLSNARSSISSTLASDSFSSPVPSRLGESHARQRSTSTRERQQGKGRGISGQTTPVVSNCQIEV